MYETVRNYVLAELVKQAAAENVPLSEIQLTINPDAEDGTPEYKILKKGPDGKYHFLKETDFYKITGLKQWQDWKKRKEQADTFLGFAFQNFSNQLGIHWAQLHFLLNVTDEANAKPRVYLYSGQDKCEQAVSWKEIFLTDKE